MTAARYIEVPDPRDEERMARTTHHTNTLLDVAKKISIVCGAITALGAVIVGVWWVLSPRVATAYCSVQRCEDLSRVDGALASQVTGQVDSVRREVTALDNKCSTARTDILLTISQHETTQAQTEGALQARLAGVEAALRYLVGRQGGDYDRLRRQP